MNIVTSTKIGRTYVANIN